MNDPVVDLNPYNFVSFAGEGPWLLDPPHKGHQAWFPDLLHGVVTFTLCPVTPLIVPGPARPNAPFHFFRMRRTDGAVHYAIPGSSLKGALRSMVEAVANDRLGIVTSKHANRPEITQYARNVCIGRQPSPVSIAEIAAKWIVPENADRTLAASSLGIADLLFGFAAPHRRGENGKVLSHPFQGKVRLETGWGPPALSLASEADPSQPCAHLQLAPLMAPKTETQGKAQRLYLKRDETSGNSGTFSDAPEMAGRKFYWPQIPKGDARVHEAHLFHPDPHNSARTVRKGPEVFALTDARFTCRLEFENLSSVELGALLFVLHLGAEDRLLHLGKGKPRGLGSCSVFGQEITYEAPANRYSENRLSVPNPDPLADFKAWCSKNGNGAEFDSLPHVRDFVKLHTKPRPSNKARAYPRFGNYNFPLNKAKADRPPGLTPARDQ